MTSSLDSRETASLVRQAAIRIGGPGELARHLKVGRPHVMRLIQGRSTPNAIALAALRAVLADDTAPEADGIREKGTTYEQRTS